MGLWEGIKKSATDPRYLRGAGSRILTKWNRRYHEFFVDHVGTDVMGEDWDNLIILDGCRADVFNDVSWLEGTYEECISQASESREYLSYNFQDRELHDTVYLSANPFAAQLNDGTFHAFYDLYRTEWDEELNTVPPEPVADKTIEAHREFPNKRIISHFMQPHYPFIGELGQEIDHSSIGGEMKEEDTPMNIWSRLMYGESGLDRQQVLSAYEENLEIVLESVERVIENTSGKTVVTADHGNMIGDRGRPIPAPGFGHPPNYYVEPLVNVPWLTISGERREIESESPVGEMETPAADVDIEDRLSHLGYVD